MASEHRTPGTESAAASTANEASWLTDDVISAVIDHMNSDHTEDNVVICRGLGGAGEVTSAVCAALDVEAVTFAAESLQGPQTVRVPFASPLVDRPQIRAELARMYHESAAMLGLPPRT